MANKGIPYFKILIWKGISLDIWSEIKFYSLVAVKHDF